MEAWMVAGGIVMSVVALLTPIPGNVIVAARWFLYSFFFLATTSDTKKTKVPPAPLKRARSRKVRVVFIRHAESIWNCVVNRFGLAWPYRFFRYSLETVLMVLGNRNDSVVIDSPLSTLGEQQAADLAAFLKSPEGRKAVSYDPQSSVVVCSNLRRAMATGALGLDGRLRENRGEKIVIDSSLQEGSRNADAHSFMTQKFRLVDSPVLGYGTAVELGNVFDPSLSLGNKSRTGNVYKRMDAFAARVFGEGPDGLASLPGSTPSTVIAVGHSLWFKNFFGRYLPEASTHVAKKKKMKNCAVVSFDLEVDDNGKVFVDEYTIKAHYLGFNTK